MITMKSKNIKKNIIVFPDGSLIDCIPVKYVDDNTIFVKWSSENGIKHEMYLPKEFLK